MAPPIRRPPARDCPIAQRRERCSAVRRTPRHPAADRRVVLPRGGGTVARRTRTATTRRVAIPRRLPIRHAAPASVSGSHGACGSGSTSVGGRHGLRRRTSHPSGGAPGTWRCGGSPGVRGPPAQRADGSHPPLVGHSRHRRRRCRRGRRRSPCASRDGRGLALHAAVRLLLDLVPRPPRRRVHDWSPDRVPFASPRRDRAGRPHLSTGGHDGRHPSQPAFQPRSGRRVDPTPKRTRPATTAITPSTAPTANPLVSQPSGLSMQATDPPPIAPTVKGEPPTRSTKPMR